MSEIKLKYDNFDICRTVSMKYGRCVVDATLIVPDIKADIKKILCVSSDAYITHITPAKDKVIVEGAIKAAVIYQPDDDKSMIKSLVLRREFSHTLDVKDADSDSLVQAETEVFSADATLINSRKVNVRITIEIGCRVSKKESIQIPVGTEGSQAEIIKKPEFLDMLPFKIRGRENETETQNCDVNKNLALKKVPLSFAIDNFTSEGSIIVRDKHEVSNKNGDIAEVILTNVSVEPDEVLTEENNIKISGNLKLNILYEETTGDTEASACVRTAEFNVPFSENMSLSQVSDDMECEVEYAVREVYTEIVDNADGEAKVLGLEIVLGVFISGYQTAKPEALCDVYTLDSGDIKTETIEISPEQIADVKTMEVTLKSTAKRNTDTQPAVDGVCIVKSTGVTVEDIKFDENKATVKGYVDCRILYLSNDENQPMSYIDHRVDLNHEFMLSEVYEGKIACDAKVFVNHIGYAISDADSIDLRLIVALGLKIVKNDKVKLINAMELEEGENKNSEGVINYIVYFVQSGDTLWDIAKHYKTTVDKIVETNNILDKDNLHIGQKIRITV